MAKQSGLGDNLYIDGVDISGDVGSLGQIGGGNSPIDVTGIDKSARERLGGVRDGTIAFSAFFNPTGAHLALSALPTTDRVLTYCRGTSLGDPAASFVAKQIGYDPTRDDSGSLTIAVSAQANGYGLEWGRQLTAGKRTDTTATNGASIDTAASASFGLQAYLHVFAFTGTSVTVKLQDSADNSAWADVSGAAFAAVSAVGAQRIAVAGTVRRYLRAVTTGTFSNAVFSVNAVKNETTVSF